MAIRGRKRTATIVKLATGNPVKRPVSQGEPEPGGPIERPAKLNRLLKNTERTHLLSNNRIRAAQRLNQSCVLAVILESMLLATPYEKPFSAAC
jgi:hypothetical protein